MPKTARLARPMALMTAALLIYVSIHIFQRTLSDRVEDFRAYYDAACELRDNRDPYLVDPELPYVYPPLIAFLIVPLTQFPIGIAAAIFAPLLIGSVVLALVIGGREMIHRLEVPNDKTMHSAVILLTSALMFDRIRADLQMFQVNSVMLLMMTLALQWLDRFPIRAGVALGVVMNIKYLSLAFLPYLLIRRRWIAATSMLVWMVIFALLPASLVGWENNSNYLSQALGRLQDVTNPERTAVSDAPKALDRSMSASLSISIPSAVARIMRDRDASEFIWLVVGGIAAVVGAYVLCAYRRFGISLLKSPDIQVQREQPWRAQVGLEWALLIGFTLVFSPQTNSRHWLMLTMLAILLVVVLFTQSWKDAWRYCLVGVLLLLGGLTLPPGNMSNPMLFRISVAWTGYGGPSWVILIALLVTLSGGLAYVRDLKRKRAPSEILRQPSGMAKRQEGRAAA